MIGWNSPSSRSCYGEDKAVIVSAPYFFLNSKSDWRRRNEPASHKSPPWLCCCCRCWPRSACPLMNSTTWKPFHLWAHLDQPWSQKTIESHQLTHNTKTLTRPPLHLWTPITIHSPVSHFGLQITPPTPSLHFHSHHTNIQTPVWGGVGGWEVTKGRAAPLTATHFAKLPGTAARPGTASLLLLRCVRDGGKLKRRTRGAKGGSYPGAM